MIDAAPAPLFLSFFAGLALGLGAAAVLGILWRRSIGQTQDHLLAQIKAMAADTLHANSATFLQMASAQLDQKEQAAQAHLTEKTRTINEMIKPVRETLQRMDTQLHALEVKREGAYRELSEMVASSRQTQQLLRQETSQLLQALRAPTGRGRWGEIQLQRILEMTGMSEHARDFSAQETMTDADGTIRPDMIVFLPGERRIIIDSKVPLTAYLDSVQSADDGARAQSLKQHARQLRDHIKKLGSKTYWDKMPGSPEFVVLFLPGEHFLSAALDGDTDLMDFSIAQKVVLATPMTMVAMLRAVAYGWRQEAMHQNVRAIGDLGRKLHTRLAGFAKVMGQTGIQLGKAVESYNKAVNTLESKILADAEKLGAYGASAEEENITPPAAIAHLPRISSTQNDADDGDDADQSAA